ncbi:MAG: LysR family transcriptional regulator [Betaproteobacteria bacterium]|nr:LysR family transcriptional regulator [Betaproteobacteria bacterium]
MTPRDALTPDAIALLEAVQRTGSLAAAARELGKVPSAVSYAARRLEEALDVLLFDRRGKAAALTVAGQALLAEGLQLLQSMDDAARRIRRIAGGWETRLAITIDQIVRPQPVFELIERFYGIECGTQLRVDADVLQGPWDGLVSGRIDLAIGAVASVGDGAPIPGLSTRPLGRMRFVLCMAPHHPLAGAAEPLDAELLRRHRAIAVADTARRMAPYTIGLLPGQPVLTLPTMQAKIAAQVQGLGLGYLPEHLAAPLLGAGRLVSRRVDTDRQEARIVTAWRTADKGQALQWWLDALGRDATRAALLGTQGWTL